MCKYSQECGYVTWTYDNIIYDAQYVQIWNMQLTSYNQATGIKKSNPNV